MPSTEYEQLSCLSFAVLDSSWYGTNSEGKALKMMSRTVLDLLCFQFLASVVSAV